MEPNPNEERQVLERELETFESRRDKLVDSAEGMFALIKGDEIEGVYPQRSIAIARGYELWGNVPFLVKQVEAVDTVESFVSFHVDF